MPFSRYAKANGDRDSRVVVGDGKVGLVETSNRCREGKAQSRSRQCAAAFEPIETLKDLIPIVYWDARAIVRDDGNSVVLLAP